METQKTRRIENVATLDLREATEASIADILSIGNVAVVLYSPDTAHLVSRISMGNVASVIEVPADAKISNGQETWSRDSFKNRTTPLSLVLSGQLIIHPDVPEADLEQGVREMIVSGQILCPDHLAGILQPKIRILNGQIQTYRAGAKLQIGGLVLDENYLRALGEAAELVVIGKVTVPETLPNDLLEQKLRRLQVIGKLVCREENAQVLLSRLEDQVKSSTIIIPAGFTWIERSIVLDAGTLETLSGNKLYCGGRVQLGDDVEAQILDQALEKLVVKDVLLAPAKLRAVLARKCNLLETRAIFYSGELWLVENEMTLLASRFNYLEGKATLVVQGELIIDPEVEPKTLAERLEKVHNFGEIFCNREQMGALQARLGTNEGELLDTSGAEEEGQGSIGNVAYLKL